MELLQEEATFAEWINIVKGEYREMPGLRLSKPQAQRLWGLDRVTCEALLDHLEASKFLKRTAQDTYVKADGESD